MIRHRRGLVLALLLAAAAALPGASARAQSFNCRYAKAPDEVLICQLPRLSALDERMASIYFRLRNRLQGGQLRALEAEQAAWLRQRSACGRDAECIAAAYLGRIQELLLAQ